MWTLYRPLATATRCILHRDTADRQSIRRTADACVGCTLHGLGQLIDLVARSCVRLHVTRQISSEQYVIVDKYTSLRERLIHSLWAGRGLYIYIWRRLRGIENRVESFVWSPSVTCVGSPCPVTCESRSRQSVSSLVRWDPSSQSPADTDDSPSWGQFYQAYIVLLNKINSFSQNFVVHLLSKFFPVILFRV